MIDIDDTIVDRFENVVYGFEYMRDLYMECDAMKFPIHIVTARPRSEKISVLEMLRARGFAIRKDDHLHMLPTELWGKGNKYIIDFKWKVFKYITTVHHGCVARFGDQLWDVAHYDSLDNDLRHIDSNDCYVFCDPRLQGTISCKLPGK